MSFVNVAPDILGQAAGDLENIGSSLGAANFAAAAPTTGVLAPGADEVSLVIAALLGTHAQEYQALCAQASTFHAQFVSMLNSGAASYAATEAANAAQALVNAVAAPIQSLLGTPGAGGIASAASTGGGLLAPYGSLIANTSANLRGIESTFASQTAPLLVRAATNPFGAPQVILKSLEAGNVAPLLALPKDIATGSAQLTTALSAPISISNLAVNLQTGTASVAIGASLPEQLAYDGAGALINGGVAAVHSSTVFSNALTAGNLPAAFGAAFDAPANVLNGFLNGTTDLALSTNVAGSLLSVRIPFSGLLVPVSPFSVTAHVPGFPLVNTLNITGPPTGGLIPALVNGLPQLIANDIVV